MCFLRHTTETFLENFIKICIFITQGDEEIDEEFQKNLKLLFDKMKTSHQKMLFGLRIHRDAEVNKKCNYIFIYPKNTIIYKSVKPGSFII